MQEPQFETYNLKQLFFAIPAIEGTT